ncbi:hypothetical protein [Intestinibacillus massiliensis]|uniref:hypothetical protein n=1 Tax=Intestinibacillus massiliensis TaxID=1871029 RepID=UPI001356589D|nr:hypothetical protein [Intestinibacillus massiliensis]
MPFLMLAEGDSSAIVSAIQSASTSLQADAVTVIGLAVALGVVFFGSKLLWNKFKGMAK